MGEPGTRPRTALFEPMDDETRARLDDLCDRQGLGLFDPRVQAALQQKWQLYFQQPDGTPDVFPSPLGGLYENPGPLASTARWQAYRDILKGFAEMHPDDANFPVMVAAAEDLLLWREALALEDRFWKPDT
jgi:hypothetical protein